MKLTSDCTSIGVMTEIISGITQKAASIERTTFFRGHAPEDEVDGIGETRGAHFLIQDFPALSHPMNRGPIPRLLEQGKPFFVGSLVNHPGQHVSQYHLEIFVGVDIIAASLPSIQSPNRKFNNML